MVKDSDVIIECPVSSFSWEKIQTSAEKRAYIPLYSDASRSKFIVSVPACCQGEPSTFRLAGASFILSE
jgi:hypothetical protein